MRSLLRPPSAVVRLLSSVLLLALPTLAFAQGALTPPADAFSAGAPAASMKTLDQLEARTPIGKVGGSTGQIVIDHPGSYVLLGDLTATGVDPIRILSGDVTIDLNGFTVAAQDSAAGISGTVLVGDIVIRNGRIVGTTTYDGKAFTTKGASYGIAIGPFLGTCTIADVTIRGMREAGIQIVPFSAASPSSIVRRCTVSVCKGYGIVAGTITDSTAETCGGTALSALTVTNSVGISVVTGSGIRAYTVTNSYGQSQSAYGIVADNDNVPHLGNATNCRGVSATGTGLFATAATNCVGISTSGTGLDTNSDKNGYTGTATGCVGRSASGHGLIASIATNCHGFTEAATMYGLWVSGTATGCRGTNTAATGIALRTDIAVGCTAAAGSISANSKQLGTP